MTQVVSNDVSAIQPEIWSAAVQVPLYKSLVALEVCNTRLSDEMRGSDTIHIPRFGDLSAQTYTPGTTLSATNQDWAFDNIVVSTYKHATFYVDNARRLTLNVDQARELATDAAFRLRDKIDTLAFSKITGSLGGYTVDQKDLGLSSSGNAPVSAGSANIINIFAGARKFLRERNVEEMGDWCAVVTPKGASYIETKAATVGFNVADATLRNGYAGDFMGFQVYISNNLPSGNLSAISPAGGSQVMSAAGFGGPSGANASGTTPGRAWYLGRKKMIDVVMLKAPALEVRPLADRIGSNYITWTVYGAGIVKKNAARFINLSMPTAFSG